MFMLKSTHERITQAAVEHCEDYYQMKLADIRGKEKVSAKTIEILQRTLDSRRDALFEKNKQHNDNAPLVKEALARRASLQKSEAKRTAKRRATAAANKAPTAKSRKK
jgi:hypothetical protein